MADGERLMADGESSAVQADHRQDHPARAEERVERARRRVDRVARADGGDYACGRSPRGFARRRDVLGAITVVQLTESTEATGSHGETKYQRRSESLLGCLLCCFASLSESVASVASVVWRSLVSDRRGSLERTLVFPDRVEQRFRDPLPVGISLQQPRRS